MDQERFVTIEEMEAATASLLENGKKVGADSWQQRVKNQTPHCGFGEAGTCCRICAMPLPYHAEEPARHLRLRRARHRRQKLPEVHRRRLCHPL